MKDIILVGGIHNEFEWLPETKFADGIKKTIQ